MIQHKITLNKLLNSPNLALIFFFIAFSIRLFVNIFVNPIESLLIADMQFYDLIANSLSVNPFEQNDFLAFYPPGTSILLALIKITFGPLAYLAIEIIYALLESISVVFFYNIAKLVSHSKIVPPSVLFIATFNVNAILFGSCLLSQTFHVFFMSLGLLCILVFFQSGKKKYHILAGSAFGIAILVRPEIILFIFLLCIFFLVKYFKQKNKSSNISLIPLLSFLAPIILCISFGVAKFYIHTGHLGFAHNGIFNLILARCHNTALQATGNNLSIFFPHDSFAELHSRKPEHINKKLQFSYAVGSNQGTTLIIDCLKETGVLKQIIYSLDNLMFLWKAPLWPLYKHPSESIRNISNLWYKFFDFYFAPLSLISLVYFLLINRTNDGLIIISLSYLSLLLSALIVFGDPRFNIPYHSIIVLLSLEFLAQIKSRWRKT